MNPIADIENIIKDKIDAFIGTTNEDGTYKDRIYQSARSTSDQISTDYGRRYLVELIQNGYDAHPANKNNGQIKIYFDPNEDCHGVLYVANKGNYFTYSNLKALSDIGLSDKPVGESIGNKGLGFRSVRYVSDDPQIYSCLGDPQKYGYNGYCFRFARADDFGSWVKNPNILDLAQTDIPPFHIPVYLESLPEKLKLFNDEGFVTVIRLPLRDEAVKKSVFDELAKINDSRAPILLFLRRISILDAYIEGDEENSFQLRRKQKTLYTPKSSNNDNDFELCKITLDDNQKYLVAWKWLSERTVKEKITESIANKDLHESWRDWKGKGELAIAVRLDDEEIDPLLYTFLPMGTDARAPFTGFLHGSFYPKSDRTSLRADIPLNRLYIIEAIELSAKTVKLLVESSKANSPLIPDHLVGNTVIDLITWLDVGSIDWNGEGSIPSHLDEIYSSKGLPIRSSEIFPIYPCSNGNKWGTIEQIWRWDNFSNLKVFSAGTLAQIANIQILDFALDGTRIQRLENFLEEFDKNYFLKPDAEELAGGIELIAKKLLKQKALIEIWQKYYLEFKVICEKVDGIDFTERRFLLCNNGQLRGSQKIEENYQLKKRGRRRKALKVEIFAPGERLLKETSGVGGKSVFQIPKALSKGFAFLDERLDWSGRLEQVRKLLEEKKLIRKYDAEEIIAQISRIAHTKATRRVRLAALSWLFKLYCATPDKLSILRRARLFVPTEKDRWVPAETAVFSRDWPPRTLGEITSEFLDHAFSYSEELEALHSCLIAPPTSRPFANKKKDLWTDFLSEIGVQSGLHPFKKDKSRFSIRGRRVDAKNLCDILGFGDKVLKHWGDEARVSGESAVYQSSFHTIDENFWYFLGQNAHDEFSDPTKKLYAVLILNWLREANSHHFKFTFYSSSARFASRFDWPTPLASFLRQAEWLPMEIKDDDAEQRKFFRPSEVWLADELKSGRIPYFLPQFDPRIRRLIGDNDISKPLSEFCGANVLNDNQKETLIHQINYLGSLWALGTVDRFFQMEFMNLYNGTWQKLLSLPGNVDWKTDGEPSNLIICQKNTFVSLPMHNTNGDDPDDSLEEIYVQDSDSSLRSRLLLSLSKAVFDPNVTSPKKLSEVLKPLLEERFRSINELDVEFILDGTKWEASGTGDDLLVDRYPWVTQIICLAIESLTGTAARRIPFNRGIIIDRLNRMRLRVVVEVNIRIGGKVLGLPEELYGVLGVKDKLKPALIFQLDEGNISWSTFARASNAISEVLEIPDIANSLKLIFRGFERLNTPLGHELNIEQLIDELCPDLHLNPKQAKEIIKFVENDKNRAVRFIKPVIHYFFGADCLEEFSRQVKSADSVWDLIGHLKRLLEESGIDVEQLIRISMRAVEFSDIRVSLKLDFARFNTSLCELGEDPETYADLHKESFDAFIKENFETIIDRLRNQHLDSFRKRESLQIYLSLKIEINNMGPDPNWLLSFMDIDEALMQPRIDNWFLEKGVASISETELAPYYQARKENIKQLKSFIRNNGNLVRVWCRNNNAIIPTVWNDPVDSINLIAQAFDNAGVLDFDILDDTLIISWTVAMGHWPDSMPQSSDLNVLGLLKEDLDSEKLKEREIKQKREKEKRSVEINGKLIDPQEIDPEDAAAEIFDNLNKHALNTKLSQELDLKTMSKADTGKKPPSGSAKGGRSAGGKLNSDRNEFVGYLGECAVYHWLKKLLPKQDIESAWVSKNKNKLLPGPGNDKLGYDFVIKYKKQDWYLEVKTSVGDPQMFHMGESEVRFATQCASQRGKAYKIVYISNIDDSSKTDIEVLPNPMGGYGSKGYRIGGKGFRLSFQRK